MAKEGLTGSVKETKATKEVKTTEEKVESQDLSKLTVAELKEMAAAKNIAGATSMKKAELIDALK
ncbi:MAG: Rho termination factor N-terminal domain-containing protein [Bacilli bacterium]|nr:Rho termination factor N-terminal domain-containing protein [Bacilli bacterium]